MINPVGTQTILTDRLILRKYRLSDVQDIFDNWAANPNVCRYFTWSPHETTRETASLVQMWMEQYDEPLVFHWIIEEKELRQAIGAIYLDDLRESDSSASASCLLGERFWGKGYAAEAAKAVVQYAFETVGLSRVDARCHEQNTGSQRALEKSGFQFIEKKAVVYPVCSRLNGDYLFYSISKEEWRARAGMPAGKEEK